MDVLLTLAFVALAAMFVLLLLVLFEPSLPYAVKAPTVPLDSEDYLRLMAALAGAPVYRDGSVELLGDGKVFYEAELAAIEQARVSIHIEVFIFHPSAIGDRVILALTERAQQGVAVKVVIDAVGSFVTPESYFETLRRAGGRVMRYQPVRFGTLKRLNNRTHRDVFVIDGKLGLVGGAGIANHWDTGDKGKLPWRDMMFRVRGGLARGLQTTFAENWLEASGEILAAPEDFPPVDYRSDHPSAGMVVISSPTAGRSTRNRVLFQTLIASARRTIFIHSPYFLPDRSAAAELVRAAKERSVKVKIIVPGRSNNHLMTRLASRRHYGQLLQGGVEIYEYQPGMIHSKALTVDGLWVVVGSTNFDSRSFDLNDEVNLVAIDTKLAARVEEEFRADLAQCEQISYEKWLRRPLREQVVATAGRVLERQE